MRIVISFIYLLAAAPFSASAAVAVTAPTSFKSLVVLITGIIGKLILLIFALTFLAFMWGVIKGWVIQGGNEEGIESGKKVVFAGIVGFVVMVSVWGILKMLQSSLFGI
ncbi:MAG: hypothetical protein WAW13_02825 [Minisyncoccia bacterium]